MASGDMRRTNPENGVIGLLAGGLVLVLAIWIFAFYLSGNLARVHMRHKVQGISAQAADVLRAAGETPVAAELKPATRAELRRLMKYREVERLEIADARGRVVWASDAAARAGRISIPENAAALIAAYEASSDGLKRTFARALLPVKGTGVIAMDIDMTGLLGWYKRISLLVAKSLTAVVCGGFLVMGLILFGKYRERAGAESRLEELRRRNAEEQEKVRALRAQLEELNAGMARLNRKLAESMRGGKEAEAKGDGGGAGRKAV